MSIRIVFDSSGHQKRGGAIGVRAFVLFFALLLGLPGAPSEAWADDWGFAWEIGAITATPTGDPFVFRLTAAKTYSDEFSLGPSFYLTPYGDNAMYSGSVNAEFHVQLQELRVSPFFGLGLAHRKTKIDDDTALMIPMGLSLDMPIGENLYLLGTGAILLHDGITLEGDKDGASTGLTAGIRYSP